MCIFLEKTTYKQFSYNLEMHLHVYVHEYFYCSLSQSSLELDKNTGIVSMGTSRSLPSTCRRHSGTQRSDSELSAAACDLIQEYMDKVCLANCATSVK